MAKDCSKSLANALELLQFCTKPLISSFAKCTILLFSTILLSRTILLFSNPSYGHQFNCFMPGDPNMHRRPGPIFCLWVRSDYAQSITDQVAEVICPVIGHTQPELTPSKRQKTGPELGLLPSHFFTDHDSISICSCRLSLKKFLWFLYKQHVNLPSTAAVPLLPGGSELMKMERIVPRLNNHDKFLQQSQPGRDKTQPTNYHCISVHFSGWLGSGGCWGNKLGGIKIWEFGWQSGAPFTENKNIERHTARTIVWWYNTLTMANGSHFRFDDNHKIKYMYFHNHHKKNGYAEYTQPHILHEG